jgi:hypothetical protein
VTPLAEVTIERIELQSLRLVGAVRCNLARIRIPALCAGIPGFDAFAYLARVTRAAIERSILISVYSAPLSGVFKSNALRGAVSKTCGRGVINESGAAAAHERRIFAR